MSIKFNHLLRAVSLFILLVSLIPAKDVDALVSTAPPPVDMFQLPWDQGIAWVAIDGLDNGSDRPTSSSHNYKLGGAIDFAPHNNMVTGENTSNFWVTAAAAGTVVATSACYITLAHDNGWITQYQFLGNIQVKLGDVVARNQRLAIIADGVRLKYCPGFQDINVPHLHFMLRPTTIGASFAGWEVKYNSLFNITSFTKNGNTVGLFKPLLNTFDSTVTPTPTLQLTGTPGTPTSQPSPTPTFSGPYVSTTITPQSISIGESALVTVGLNNVPVEGYTSAEFTCTFGPNLFEVSNITVASLFGADPAAAINGPQAQGLIVAIAGSQGIKAATSGAAFTFNVKGLQAGQTVIDCRARVSQGNNVLTEIPFAVDFLSILAGTPTPILTPSFTPSFTPSPASFTPTVTPPVASATPPTGWLTFINSKYGFQFLYPDQGQLVAGSTDNYARINLPFVQGTNLREKYLEVIVAENANPCQSPLATSSILQTSETVIINGLSFLKQTGGDGAAGNLYQWVAYSISRDNVCVSLDFILHSLNPGNFPTPSPIFDYAAESAIFGQIVSFYTWLTLTPTTTPTSVPTATGSPAPTFTSTPSSSPTPAGNNGAVAGQVLASKPVIVNVYDGSTILVATMETALDGRFRLEVPAGTYTVIATAQGFLRAQGSVTLTAGTTTILPPIALLAGDIDENNVIDQFDAMTIGMGYNSSIPAAADLNNDGIINVLDLEALAKNYRKTGPVAWQ